MNIGKDYMLLHNTVYTLIIHRPFKEREFKFYILTRTKGFEIYNNLHALVPYGTLEDGSR
jgi:hypothetical protein